MSYIKLPGLGGLNPDLELGGEPNTQPHDSSNSAYWHLENKWIQITISLFPATYQSYRTVINAAALFTNAQIQDLSIELDSYQSVSNAIGGAEKYIQFIEFVINKMKQGSTSQEAAQAFFDDQNKPGLSTVQNPTNSSSSEPKINWILVLLAGAGIIYLLNK